MRQEKYPIAVAWGGRGSGVETVGVVSMAPEYR